jgi:transcriptional regulator with XRE-family HTH domain
MDTVGQRLAELIEALDIKKNEFAKVIDRSTGNVSDWLSNKCKPGKRSLAVINEKFGVSTRWLINGYGGMFEKNISNGYEVFKDVDPINFEYTDLTYTSTISRRIKKIRELLRLSQANLAEKINVSPGNVGDWETNKSKPGADALIALAKYCDVSIDWVLTGEGRGPNEPINQSEEIESLLENYKPEAFFSSDHGDEVQMKDMSRTIPNQYSDKPVAATWGSGKSFLIASLLRDILKDENELITAPATEENIVRLADYLESKAGIKNKKGIFYRDYITNEDDDCLKLFKQLSTINKGKILGKMEEILEHQKEETKGGSGLSTLTHGEKAIADMA